LLAVPSFGLILQGAIPATLPARRARRAIPSQNKPPPRSRGMGANQASISTWLAWAPPFGQRTARHRRSSFEDDARVRRQPALGRSTADPESRSLDRLRRPCCSLAVPKQRTTSRRHWRAHPPRLEARRVAPGLSHTRSTPWDRSPSVTRTDAKPADAAGLPSRSEPARGVGGVVQAAFAPYLALTQMRSGPIGP
jgi:hypothetical protein